MMTSRFSSGVRYLILLLILLFGLGGAVAADPIGLVTIKSPSDAETAQTILVAAYARSGNRFLVSADQVKQGLLQAAGLEFETIVDEAEPSDVYQIYDLDHPQAPEVYDLSRLGKVNDLGHGVRVIQLTRAEAASVSNDSQLEAVKLSDLNVPIFFPQPVVAAPLAGNYPSDSLTSRINQDSLHAYVQRLQDFQTRWAYTDSCRAARDWVAQKFRDWGYTDVTLQSFYYNGYHYNVKVVKPGVAEPDKVLVIGGHYDSYVDGSQSPGRTVFAPGADDDASGVALTLETARVLANVPLRKTIIFMPFAAEEIGLIGSSVAAQDFRASGAKLEVMYNFDMVGYTGSSPWNLNFSSGDVTVYRNFSMATATRVSSLTPIQTYMGSSSDHYSFDQMGYPVVDHIESNFSPYWHLNGDLTTKMNFPYFAEVAKTALASLAVVADAAYPTGIAREVDVGDGQSLQITLSECSPDCIYKIYWGTAPGVYHDSASMPPGDCTYTINGLLDGQTYYMLPLGTSPSGYRAFYGIEGSGVPLKYPRTPKNLAGTPASNQMRLDLVWRSNGELDFSHYRVYRRLGAAAAWSLYQDHVTDTTFSDTDVLPHVGYEYAVTAVDRDGYESAKSQPVAVFPATYDGGPVVADGFVMDHEYDPDQAEQEAWLDTILGPNGFGVAPSDENGGPVTLAQIGQYGTLIWTDDDVIVKNIGESAPALDEFSKHGTNMLISGFSTWYNWAPKSVPTTHLLYREFGLSAYDHISYFDFVGAFGDNGWPSVQISPRHGMREWPDIAKLTPRPGAQVILRFNSVMDLPEWENQPVGMIYSTPNGKRVLLSFPLYYLTPASATALMAKVFEYFGVSAHFNKGDLDNSGTIDIRDLTLLLDHLFINMQPLPDPEAADMDGRPGVSIGDVFFLINYLFLGGPLPTPQP